LLVKFIECMLYTNRCHETPIYQILTAQKIDGEVMCQSSDNTLYPLTVRLGVSRRLNIFSNISITSGIIQVDKCVYSKFRGYSYQPLYCTLIILFFTKIIPQFCKRQCD